MLLVDQERGPAELGAVPPVGGVVADRVVAESPELSWRCPLVEEPCRGLDEEALVGVHLEQHKGCRLTQSADQADNATSRYWSNLSWSRNEHRHAFPPAYRRRAGLLRVVPVDVPRREALQNLVEGHSPLQPRQRGTKAQVDAVAEGQVLVDLAMDVEGSPSGNLRSSRFAAPLNRSSTLPAGTTSPWCSTSRVHVSSLHGRRRLESEELFDRLGHELPVLGQRRAAGRDGRPAPWPSIRSDGSWSRCPPPPTG